MALGTQEKLFVQLLRKGNSKAYKQLYDEHYEIMFRVALRFVRDADVAENIVQDVMIKIWENRKSLEIKVSVRTYLLSAVRNRCINYITSVHHLRETRFSELPSNDKQHINANNVDGLGILEEEELAAVVIRCIEELPEECRRVFVNAKLEGKSYKEISEECGISSATINYHIKNAKAALRKKLSPYLLYMMLFMWQF